MARPRVFISSSFYDLKHVRSTLETFIGSLGYDPVLSEKGAIAYTPDIALDESCYREAKTCDIFILIVGGRYGSEVSESAGGDLKDFYDRYQSITRKEFETAIDTGIPTYILIDKNVVSEYETFKRNRKNTSIKYAYVDSINVFSFIDFILARPKNNPVFHFEFSSEIVTWLREQWAGLFQELIRTRSNRSQISSLAEQVTDLSSVTGTLKRYLEEIVARVGNQQEAKEIISEEEAKLSSSRTLVDLAKLRPVKELTVMDLSPEKVRDIFSSATSLNDLANKVEEATNKKVDAKDAVTLWKENPDIAQNMNDVRSVLGLPPLKFAAGDSTKRSHKKR